jgi:dTDP-4-dehydrorhamnose reductase
MILLLGASGYIGRAFADELRRRGHSFVPLTREAFDYTRFDYLFDYLRTMKPKFLINAAGYSGKIEEDASENAREQAMLANSMLPQMIARACLVTRTPWGHVSSGSIYSGCKITEGDSWRLERDLTRADVIELFESHPERFHGFTEMEEPNFSFRHQPCSFYSGTKALAEEAIRDIGFCYVWRARCAFDERDEPCNHLWQLRRQANPVNAIDSLTHLGDFARVSVELWEREAPFGIYNVANPGAVTTRRIVELMGGRQAGSESEAWKEEAIPAPDPAIPQSHCILDVSRVLCTGIRIRPIEEALAAAVGRKGTTSRRAKSVVMGTRQAPPTPA